MAQDKEQIVTPIGEAVYPHLHKPDTKFNKNGVYKTSVRFTGEAAEFMRDLLDPPADEAYAAGLKKYVERSLDKISGRPTKKAVAKFKKEAKRVVKRHTGYTYELDEDGEETDNLIIEFKTTASGTNKKGERWVRELPIFDAQGAAVDPGLKVGGGSRIRVAFTFGDEYLMHQTEDLSLAGVARYLEAVQVIELETWAERDAGSFGFGAEDGGFTAEDADEGVFAGAPSFDDDEDDGLPWDDEDYGDDPADF